MWRAKPSPATVIAVAALFVALGGTAIAASRYLITSAGQIKPSVVRQIVAQGTRVVTRARSATPVTTVAYPALAWVPLTSGKWVQGAQEIDQISGQITYTSPPGCGLAPIVDVFLDKNLIAVRVAAARAGAPATPTSTHRLLWRLGRTRTIVETSLVEELFEPGAVTPHQLTAEVADSCTQSHMTVNALSLDVVGIR